MENKKHLAGGFLITLILMYLLTGVLLFLLAVFMYQMDLSVQAAEIAIIVIYVIAGFVGGFLIGKRMKTRRYLWGVLIGTAYFAVLLLASLAVNGGKVEDSIQLLVTFVICAASSMIGGMVS